MGKKVLLKGSLVTDDPGDAIAEFKSDLGVSHIDQTNVFQIWAPLGLDEVLVTIRQTGYEPSSFAMRPPEQAKMGAKPFVKKPDKQLDQPTKDPSQIQQVSGLPKLQIPGP